MAATRCRTGAVVLLVMVAAISTVDAAKVALFPMNMGSHILYFGQVASALVETGHEATLYVPSNNKPPQGISPKVKIAIYKVPGDIPYGNSEESAAMEIALLTTTSMREWFELQLEWQVLIFNGGGQDCESLFVEDVWAGISSAGYELAVMDPAMYTCQYTIPYKLGIPYIGLAIPHGLWSFRVPHLPSAYPSLMTTSGDRMNFWQRLFAFSMDLSEIVLFSNNTEYYVKKYVPEKPAIGAYDLFSNVTMWWYLYDLAAGYPKPSMPNTMDIGDIMVRPAKPLPEEYLDILQKSVHGAILVSLGSHFDAVPEAWLHEFCKAFNDLKYTVIWKLKFQPPCEVASNVHIKSWVPQNDLLAHPKLVLFITHCGYNSLLESISQGKPMVGFPISIDQPYNAQFVKDRGLGEVLDLKTFTAHNLTETIQHVLSEPQYKMNARRHLRLLHDKPLTPAERISYSVNHLMEHGNAHMVSAATELNIFQFIMLDIYLFLFCSALLIIMLAAGCVYCSCRCLMKCVRGKPTQKTHRD